jgi:hypothetical protein
VDQVTAGDLQTADGAAGLAPPLHGGAGIEEALTVEPLAIHRFVAVAEHDEASAGEPTPQAGLAATPGTGIVHHRRAQAAELDLQPLGKDADQAVVVVAENGVQRSPGPQLVEQVVGDDITGVQHDICSVDVVPDLVGQLREVLVKVRVGEDDDAETIGDALMMPCGYDGGQSSSVAGSSVGVVDTTTSPSAVRMRSIHCGSTLA